MRFSNKTELTAANMAASDILAGTDVSSGDDKKFTLSGLADWFLTRNTALSMAGQNQSVQTAIDSINTRLIVVESATTASFDSTTF